MKKIVSILAITIMCLTSISASAFDNKRQTGAVTGAVVGGAVGSQFGTGSGQIAATIIGAVAGSLIGSSIGEALDDRDRMAIREAHEEALYSGRRTVVPWRGSEYGSRTGSYGSFRVLREGHHRRYAQETCKSYRSEIYTRSRTEIRTGTACQRPNGSWYEVNNNDVVYR